MRKILFCLLVVFFLLAIMPVPPVQAAVSNLEVFLRDNVVDRHVSYTVRFNTPSTLFGGRDSITMIFPSAVQIDEGIDERNISINNRDVPGISYSNNKISVMIPSTINIIAGETVEVAIASSVIQNPRNAGDYQMTLYTSQDSTVVPSAPFNITDYEYSNGVSKPYIKLRTASDNAHEYEISFKTSPNGNLTGGVGRIYLVFPTYTEMPSYIEGRHITVNQQDLRGQAISLDGRILSFQLPASLDIAPKASVNIIISAPAGLKNPRASEYNTLKVYTSTESREITSFPYELAGSSSTTTGTADQKKDIEVLTTPNGKGVNAAYTIKIQPLALRTLGSDASGFVLRFPQTTGFPSTISPQYVKVNGQTVTGVISNAARGELIFTLNQSISSSQAIEITIAKEAGLKNPPPAMYKLDVGFLMGIGTVLSEYYTIRETSTNDSQSNNNTNPGQNTTEQGDSSDSTAVAATVKNIRLSIDSIIASIDGTTSLLDAAPLLKNDVTMVPLRFVANALGAQADYHGEGNYVSVKYGTKEMTLWVDSQLAKVDATFTSLAVPASIINGRLMVPLRFISENFGAVVQWDGSTRSITIQQEVEDDSGSQTTPDSPSPTTTSPYPLGYQATIKAGNSYSNLRQGPSTSYLTTGKVLPGQSMTILQVQGDWYKVRLTNGQDAWIAGWMVDVKS